MELGTGAAMSLISKVTKKETLPDIVICPSEQSWGQIHTSVFELQIQILHMSQIQIQIQILPFMSVFQIQILILFFVFEILREIVQFEINLVFNLSCI